MRKSTSRNKHRRVKKNRTSSKDFKQRDARKKLRLEQIRVSLDKKFPKERSDSCWKGIYILKKEEKENMDARRRGKVKKQSGLIMSLLR